MKKFDRDKVCILYTGGCHTHPGYAFYPSRDIECAKREIEKAKKLYPKAKFFLRQTIEIVNEMDV